MKFMILVLILFVHVSFFHSSMAQAYLDPATGSVLLGVLSAVGSLMVIMYEKVIRFVYQLGSAKKKCKKSSDLVSTDEILIHCESATYLPLFEPLVQGLASEGVGCQVVCTSEKELEAFQKYSNAHAMLVPNDKVFSQIMKSHSPVFVSTTPGLDVLQLQRSARFQKCVHALHAPSDMHTYAPFSFDRYDVVLCGGNYQVRSLRRLERIRGNRGRQFPVTGLLYYDDYLKKDAAPLPFIDDALLIAPTWGKTSLIYHLTFDILKSLSGQYGAVLFRFHPQSKVSDAAKRDEIISWMNKLPNVRLDQSPSSYQAIMQVSSMLTDISGIIVDFKILKPEGHLFFFPSVFHLGNKEGHWLPWEPYEVTFAKKSGTEILDASMLHRLKELGAGNTQKKVVQSEIKFIAESAKPSAQVLKELVRLC